MRIFNNTKNIVRGAGITAVLATMTSSPLILENHYKKDYIKRELENYPMTISDELFWMHAKINQFYDSVPVEGGKFFAEKENNKKFIQEKLKGFNSLFAFKWQNKLDEIRKAQSDAVTLAENIFSLKVRERDSIANADFNAFINSPEFVSFIESQKNQKEEFLKTHKHHVLADKEETPINLANFQWRSVDAIKQEYVKDKNSYPYKEEVREIKAYVEGVAPVATHRYTPVPYMYAPTKDVIYTLKTVQPYKDIKHFYTISDDNYLVCEYYGKPNKRGN